MSPVVTPSPLDGPVTARTSVATPNGVNGCLLLLSHLQPTVTTAVTTVKAANPRLPTRLGDRLSRLAWAEPTCGAFPQMVGPRTVLLGIEFGAFGPTPSAGETNRGIEGGVCDGAGAGSNPEPDSKVRKNRMKIRHLTTLVRAKSAA